MMSRMRRWTTRLLRKGCLLAALAPVGWVHGQSAPTTGTGDEQAKKIYTRNGTFYLPVQMDDKLRSTLKEVRLYVKQGNADWVRQETAPAQITHFSPKVSRDGEYWFSLVTVDREGKQTPEDVSREAPGLRVVVDTRSPSIEVLPGSTPQGDFCIRCRIDDANPNPQTLKAVSLQDAAERPLEPVPGMPGAFLLKDAALWTHPVRVTAADQAGNQASREVDVKKLVLAGMKSGGPGRTDIQTTSHRVDSLPTPTPTPIAANPVETKTPTRPPRTTPPPLPGETARLAPETTGTPSTPSVPPVLPTPPAAPGVQGSVTAFPETPRAEVPPTAPVPPSVPSLPPTVQASRPVAGEAPSERRFLNTTHAGLEYRIDQVGPSGVGKVEVYASSDQGRTWGKLKEDVDRRSPVEVDFPGEGVFGIHIIVTNGNGFGGRAPRSGDAPSCWIEVDTTRPFVQLLPIEPIAKDGKLEIRWTATDKNLPADSVNLFFRTRPDGPWQPLARGRTNEGSHFWSFPRDQGANFWIKVEATDRAGNLAQATTPSPVVLDMTEPRAQVVGVTGLQTVPTPPTPPRSN